MTTDLLSSIPASPPAPAGKSAPAASPNDFLVVSWPWRFTVDIRYVAPVLITLILLVAQLSFGLLEGYSKTILAVGVSIVTEIVLGYLLIGRCPHLASAYVSGISCGILVRSPEWWPFVLAPLVSITSKYVIRYHGRHLWNPSNLGVATLLFLAPATVASLSIQWGNSLGVLALVWAIGLTIVWRLKRLHICATYIAAFVGYALLRSVFTGDPWVAEIAPITGPMYQLFIFFMITDPKSTVRTKRGQILVAFLIATMECLLRLRGEVHAPYYALFLVGPAANFIEIWRDKRREAGRPSAAPQTAVPA
jgi:Na+-translocating ferredoxin:NAD+ oxidoreductase RnfD subunit